MEMNNGIQSSEKEKQICRDKRFLKIIVVALVLLWLFLIISNIIGLNGISVIGFVAAVIGNVVPCVMIVFIFGGYLYALRKFWNLELVLGIVKACMSFFCMIPGIGIICGVFCGVGLGVAIPLAGPIFVGWFLLLKRCISAVKNVFFNK